jgi:hypothetical protein
LARSKTKIAGSRSIGQRQGSADSDQCQNVTDPKCWVWALSGGKVSDFILVYNPLWEELLPRRRGSDKAEFMLQFISEIIHKCNYFRQQKRF